MPIGVVRRTQWCGDDELAVAARRIDPSREEQRGYVKTLTLSVALAASAVALAPVARADMSLGNYELQIVGRYDFHTGVWTVSGCYTPGSRLPVAGCVHVAAVARPIAKAFNYEGYAQLADDRYTLTVDVPDGLRCGDIYYGPTIPTHDTYSWDPTTLAGSLESSFATGCDGAPAGTYMYPFTLVRM
jgi:hypothetical protein